MLSAPVSGVATRNATVAPGVAPCLRSPSAVGSTPQEHKGNGAPRTDPQSTDLTFPVPISRVSSRPGTRTARTPASRKPKRRKTEASSRISQVSRKTSNRKPIIIVPLFLRLLGGCRFAPRRRLAEASPPQLELLRQIFFVQRASHGELRIDDVGNVKVSRLTKQFDSFVPLEAIVLHQPVDHVSAGEPQGVDQRPRAADRHDFIVVDQARPIDLLALDQVHGELDREGRLDRGTIDLTVALSGVTVAQHEQRARLEHRKLHGDPGDNLIEVHVRAVRPRIERADALLAGRSRADGTEERPDRNLDFADLAVRHIESGDLAVLVEMPDEQVVWDSRRYHRGLVLGCEQPEVRD